MLIRLLCAFSSQTDFQSTECPYYIMCLISSVPVKFRAATYDVTEGQSTVELTLEAGVDPTNELTVYVVTQDRTALGEYQ